MPILRHGMSWILRQLRNQTIHNDTSNYKEYKNRSILKGFSILTHSFYFIHRGLFSSAVIVVPFIEFGLLQRATHDMVFRHKWWPFEDILSLSSNRRNEMRQQTNNIPKDKGKRRIKLNSDAVGCVAMREWWSSKDHNVISLACEVLKWNWIGIAGISRESEKTMRRWNKYWIRFDE